MSEIDDMLNDLMAADVSDILDSETGRKIIEVIACHPQVKTRTKEKLASRLLKQVPKASVEFSLEVVRAKYNTKEPKCNAYCVAFVGYILDDQIPEEIQAEIDKKKKK